MPIFIIMKIKSYSTFLVSLFITFISFVVDSQVLSKGINFQGVIKTLSGRFPTFSGTTVLVKILSPNDCILREETFSGINISNGYLNLAIGRGTPTSNKLNPARELKAVMNNSDSFYGLKCLSPDGALHVDKTT